MQFLEISDGLSVNIEDITAFQAASETETSILIGGETHVCPMPYDTFKLLMQSMAKHDDTTYLEQLAKFQTRPVP